MSFDDMVHLNNALDLLLLSFIGFALYIFYLYLNSLGPSDARASLVQIMAFCPFGPIIWTNAARLSVRP